jgi:ABC-type glycerol-3-phosphate transport system permease component
MLVTSRLRKFIDKGLTHLLLGTISIMMLFPVIYIAMTSFKTKGDVLTSPATFFPPTWSFDGYRQVLNSNMLRYYLPNTFVNSMASSLLVTPIAGLAGYTFSRYKFWGSRWLELGILSVMMLPGLTNLIPLYRMASDLNLLSTNAVMIAVYVGGELPFGVWIIRSFFDNIPYELEEAALVDGATPFGALLHIVLPLAAPGIFSAFLFSFVNTWNDFLAALVLLSKASSKTATVGLLDFQSQFEVSYHVQAAACVLIALPVVVLFILTNRILFRAMIGGALKQ